MMSVSKLGVARSYFHSTPRLQFVIMAAVLVAFMAWTWKLLEPRPVPESLMGELHEISDWVPFLMAKCAHLVANIFFAAMIWLLVPSRKWVVVLVGLLMLQGMGTEIAQTYIPNRTCGLRDVLIDWAGVGLGLLLCWRATRK
jgi:hypothetical protein